MPKRAADVAEQLSEDLEAAAENVTKENVEQAALEALIPVALDAKANAPVDEGDLRESITVKKFSESEEDLGEDFIGGALVGPGVFYGIFVEIGADQPAQPYLRSAFDSQKDRIVERFAENLEESLFADFA